MDDARPVTESKRRALESARLNGAAGVACPHCSATISIVTDSRQGAHGTVRRRRICAGCERRFTTYESADNGGLMVTAFKALAAIRNLHRTLGVILREARDIAAHVEEDDASDVGDYRGADHSNDGDER